MNEVKSIKRMLLVFDAAVHVNATSLTGIALDRRRFIHDHQLGSMGCDLQFVTGHDRHH
jgi:hypothetical protein